MANKSKKRKDLRQDDDNRQQVNEQQDASVNLRGKAKGITTPSANMERNADRNSKGKERP
jgi:hypothetical protein